MKYSIQDGITANLSKIAERASTSFAEYEKILVIRLNERIMELTPVWEGETLVNYHWSLNAPEYSHVGPQGVSIWPDHTNKMALGGEPRRPDNVAYVREQLLRTLVFKEPTDVYLTNSSDNYLRLELGLAPGRPMIPRVDGARGMVRQAYAELVYGGAP